MRPEVPIAPCRRESPGELVVGCTARSRARYELACQVGDRGAEIAHFFLTRAPGLAWRRASPRPRSSSTSSWIFATTSAVRDQSNPTGRRAAACDTSGAGPAAASARSRQVSAAARWNSEPCPPAAPPTCLSRPFYPLPSALLLSASASALSACPVLFARSCADLLGARTWPPN